MSLHAVNGLHRNVVGYVLPHEHIFCDFTPVTGDLDHLLNDVTVAIRELEDFIAVGGAAIVDTTPTDLGRSPRQLHEVGVKTGLAVVMSTGWYRRAFYPPVIDQMSTKKLAEIMIGELIEGVDLGNGQRAFAGLIGEIGVDRDHVSALEERVLRAAAIASCETGAPVSTHSSMYPVGLQQWDLLAACDVPADKVIIGHADTYLDLNYHLQLLDAGCYLQFDTIGRSHMNADEDRITNLLHLVDRGYADQLLLSTDRCFRSDLKTFGGLGYDYLFRDFRNQLLTRGLDDETYDQLTRANPLRALSW